MRNSVAIVRDNAVERLPERYEVILSLNMFQQVLLNAEILVCVWVIVDSRA